MRRRTTARPNPTEPKMADPDRPLLADAKAEVARLAADLSEMAGLRWQLAMLEARAAAGPIAR